ncbi:MAG: metal-dependent hydrolase, partial [Nanoarchaeota archaeon]|nr:metal-dependent hydrolase [Nanoarchaeota archaeon]
ISMFFVLLFLPLVENKLVFVVVTLIATYVPDIDSRYSTLGRKKINRILQIFTKHRGMTHSFTFLITITFFLTLFLPVVAFGFFLGYGLHLLEDSFTIEGIRPFYPHKSRSRGSIRTGGRLEIIVFVIFVILNLALLSVKIL